MRVCASVCVCVCVRNHYYMWAVLSVSQRPLSDGRNHSLRAQHNAVTTSTLVDVERWPLMHFVCNEQRTDSLSTIDRLIQYKQSCGAISWSWRQLFQQVCCVREKSDSSILKKKVNGSVFPHIPNFRVVGFVEKFLHCFCPCCMKLSLHNQSSTVHALLRFKYCFVPLPL